MRRFAGNKATVGPLTNVSMGLIATDLSIKMRRPESVIHSLKTLRGQLNMLVTALNR
jgi:hypothetical protein